MPSQPSSHPSETWAARDLRHLWHPFTQQADWHPLTIVAADGNYLIDEAGTRYLDGVSSLWANVHGHRHPSLDAALLVQLGHVAHSTMLGLTHPPAIELAEQLVALAPPGLSRVFYSDSGSSAVEIALKMAFQSQRLVDSRRQRFLALQNAYHGDTLGAVSVGGIDLFHRLFSPLLFHTERIEPSLDSLERVFAEKGAELIAFVVEPLIQGAAGMHLQPAGFLKRAKELCVEAGVLLIADEVATGFGRTGKMFACEHEMVAPDFLCLAKGLSGGYLPLAATLTTERVFECFLGKRSENRAFFHGHTFTGNPLGCAVALANLEVFRTEKTIERLPTKIEALAKMLDHWFADHPNVRQIRRCGLMVGIELGRDRADGFPVAWCVGARICEVIRRHGVLLRPLGDVIVLMPPLSITLSEIERIGQAVSDGISEIVGKLPQGDDR